MDRDEEETVGASGLEQEAKRHWLRLRSSLPQKPTIFEILRVSQLEEPICGVLAYLLTPEASSLISEEHVPSVKGLAARALLVEAGIEVSDSEEAELRDALVFSEKDLGENGAVDLVLESRSRFVMIEVKNAADLGPEQLEKYERHYRSTGDTLQFTGILLLPDSNPAKISSSSSFKRVRVSGFARRLSSALDNLQGAAQIKALVQDLASTYSSDRGRGIVPQELVSFLLANWPVLSRSDQWEVDRLIKAVEDDVLRQLDLVWSRLADNLRPQNWRRHDRRVFAQNGGLGITRFVGVKAESRTVHVECFCSTREWQLSASLLGRKGESEITRREWMLEWAPKVGLEPLMDSKVPCWDEASVLLWQGNRDTSIEVVADTLDRALGILMNP